MELSLPTRTPTHTREVTTTTIPDMAMKRAAKKITVMRNRTTLQPPELDLVLQPGVESVEPLEEVSGDVGHPEGTVREVGRP